MNTSKYSIIAAFLGAVSCAQLAHGSIILIGDDLYLDSYAIDGVLDNAPHQFSQNDLHLVHESLAASGIETNSVITIVPVETDAGLSLMMLIDSPISSEVNFGAASLSMTTTAPESATWFVNDYNQDITGHIEGSSGLQTAYGLFNWNPHGHGDGFAWSNLNAGDQLTAFFTAIEGQHPTFPGLDIHDNIQFVTWLDNGWNVAETVELNSGGTYSFTALVLPAPGSLALLGLAGLHGRRRRRMA